MRVGGRCQERLTQFWGLKTEDPFWSVNLHLDVDYIVNVRFTRTELVPFDEVDSLGDRHQLGEDERQVGRGSSSNL